MAQICTKPTRVRRSGAIVMALATAAAFLAAGEAASAPTTSTRPAIVRLSGADRYATAAAVSAGTFAPGVAVAYVATGLAYPDALAGAAVASGHGPVLFVAPDSVPAATAAELHRLAPKRLVILGGTLSVSAPTAAAAQAAAGGVPLSRLAGLDRYATAAAVSAATFAPGVSVLYVATGMNFPDALTGAAAAAGHGPVLLVAGDFVPPVTATEVRRLAPKRVVVLGGTVSVSSLAAATVQAAAGGVSLSRLAGPDRFATAAAVSEATFSPGVAVVYVASGEGFPDALAGAAAAGGRGPVLLVTSATVPDVIAGELRRLTAASTVVLGQDSSVGPTVATLSDAVTAQGIPAPSPSAANAVVAAQAQLGKPYLWGGAGPDAFDCSGLTAWAWKAAGLSLPHNALAQDDLVANIPVSAVAPGDLVFFYSPVGHVGIVVGKDQMIEAAHTGTPVRISTFLDRPDLNGAARPLP